jgi:hypothetical protein
LNIYPNGEYFLSIKLRIGEASFYHSNDFSKSVTSSKCFFSIQDSKGMKQLESGFILKDFSLIILILDTIGQFQHNNGISEAVWIVPHFIFRDALLNKKNGFLARRSTDNYLQN